MLLSSPETSLADARDHAACREAIRMGSRTFFAASMLLPGSVRQHAFGLYAFCRLSDDAIDLAGGSFAALERLRDRLIRACDRRPLPFAADRAMAEIIRQFAIPRCVPEALLDGLEWDVRGRRYDDLPQLLDYAARVAGTVGVMMTLIMGVREPGALARACDLGVAMQLTNIARDVGEDARAGRLYLPLNWLRGEGIDPAAFVANPILTPQLQRVIARLLAEADRLYARAQAGMAELPAICRPAILAAALLYAEIGRRLESLSLDSIGHRARVPGSRKVRILGRALMRAPLLRNEPPAAPLDAAAFLVAAVAATPAPGPRARRSGIQTVPQFLRVLEIFERLERSQQYGTRP
jgi:15-cis-phytoene synthase